MKDARKAASASRGCRRIFANGSTRCRTWRTRSTGSEHSRILEPVDRVRAYRGLELKVFWGTDRPAERLFVLADRPEPANVDDEAEASLGSAPTARARQRYRESSSPYSRSRPWLDSAWCFACLTSLADGGGLDGGLACRRPLDRRRRGERLIRFYGAR